MQAPRFARPLLPPEAWEPILRVARLASRPLDRFLHIEAASGILLMLSAAVALVWANSAWGSGYERLWQTPLGFRIGEFTFERSLQWIVNDGLMAIFFFVVGMEIRREIHHGALSEWRQAALPVAAALGGVVVPAGLYLLIAGAPETRPGWGVPMATDIAFAVGILTLLGKRVPAALRVTLLALAIIDDLCAILVIAFFYSSGLSVSGALVAAAGLGGVVLMQRLGVRSKWAYVVPSVVAWAGIYSAGVHPTIAGVIVGLMTPVRAWFGPEGMLIGIREEIDRIAAAGVDSLSPHELASTLRRVDMARREAISPAEGLIEKLHPWVAFGIMPVFALANAGVNLGNESLDSAARGVVTAVAVGLLVGKPFGVLLASLAALRLRIASLPEGLGARHLVVLGVVAGVGFTMSLFIAQLAFTDARLLAAAKIGVLAASGAAAVFALALGRMLLSPADGTTATADEAEDSASA